MTERDEQVYMIWLRGDGLDAVASFLNCSWSRAIHEVSRILNQKNGYFGLTKPGEKNDGSRAEGAF